MLEYESECLDIPCPSGDRRRPSNARALRRISWMASLRPGVSWPESTLFFLVQLQESKKVTNTYHWQFRSARAVPKKSQECINISRLIRWYFLFLEERNKASTCSFWVGEKLMSLRWNQSLNMVNTWKLTFNLENPPSNVGHWCPLHPRHRIKSHASAATTHTIIIQQRHSTRDILKLSHTHQMTPGEVANVGHGLWYDYLDYLVPQSYYLGSVYNCDSCKAHPKHTRIGMKKMFPLTSIPYRINDKLCLNGQSALLLTDQVHSQGPFRTSCKCEVGPYTGLCYECTYMDLTLLHILTLHLSFLLFFLDCFWADGLEFDGFVGDITIEIQKPSYNSPARLLNWMWSSSTRSVFPEICTCDSSMKHRETRWNKLQIQGYECIRVQVLRRCCPNGNPGMDNSWQFFFWHWQE